MKRQGFHRSSRGDSVGDDRWPRTPGTAEAPQRRNTHGFVAVRHALRQKRRRVADGAGEHERSTEPTAGSARTTAGADFGQLTVHGGHGAPDDRAVSWQPMVHGDTRLQQTAAGPPQSALPTPSAQTVPPVVADVLASSGRPLDSSVRSQMEDPFSHDFGDVRVHTDSRAARSARAVTTRAYTLGRNVVFGAGQYRPGSGEGERILAHELAHVVQQQAEPGSVQQATSLAAAADPLEQEAHAAAEAVSAGGGPPALGRGASRAVVQTDTDGVELEQVAPAERERLCRQGIQLPEASAAAVDPRHRDDYIDNRTSAVGFSIYLGGYLVYCDGLPLPLFLPDSHVAFGLANVRTPDATIYPTRAEAVAALPLGPPAPAPSVTYYSGAGGAVIAPTLFSPATTPQFIECALRARRVVAQQVQHEAIALVGGMAVRALVSRIARRGGGSMKPPVVTESDEAFGARMAREMSEAGFRENPHRVFMRRMNSLPRRLPPQEAAEAIRVATRQFTNGTQATMPPVQIGDILVVPSRASIPNAPVMGIRADGTVMMGRASQIEVVTHTAEGAPLFPPQARIHGQITWE